MAPLRRVLAALVACAAIAGCGGGDAEDRGDRDSEVVQARIAEAARARASDFPAVRGRSLEQLSRGLGPVQAGLASSVLVPGRNRLAFGVIDRRQRFVYGPTAVYVARSSRGPARGPFVAPADSLVVDPPFRSRTSADATSDIAAIYETQVDLPDPGRWFVLTVTRNGGKLYGAGTTVNVTARDSVTSVGERAPRVDTDTLGSAGGDVKSIDTREPPSTMHDVDLRDALGKRPVALLFATPLLCQTRVCGPVVDVAEQVKAEYGDRIDFIHQEVYVDNEVSKGLRPPLRAFGLRTEPWLFTIDREGRVAARLEGSFGKAAFERAVRAAL